jgi:hypothetical protein
MKRQLALAAFLKNHTMRWPVWQEIVDFPQSNVRTPQIATG